jgi:aspartyl-tRNA(Asn)/glutamyl-tRNA(Gln) amidotransferase subunit C
MSDKKEDIDVAYLAKLARIDIAPEEAESLAEELSSILSYVEEIQQVSDVSTTSKPEHRNVLRPDSDPLEPETFKDNLLNEAPQKEGDFFKVKKIL